MNKGRINRIMSKMRKLFNVRVILRLAGSFFKRNTWLSGLTFCFIFFESVFYVLFGGAQGICLSIGLMILLIGIISLLRLGCTKRALFDIEDMLSCLYHAITCNLHIYMAEPGYYEISKKQQRLNLLYRILIGAGCALCFYIMIEIQDGMTSCKYETYPFLAIIFAVVAVIGCIFAASLLELRYRKLYCQVL